MTATWLTQVFRSMMRPFQWWVVVAPWEQGVRVRLGRRAHPMQPGIHMRIPFLDRIYVQSVRLRTLSSSNQTLSTPDGKVVTLSWGLEFAIADIVALYNSVANPDATLRTLVESRIASFVSTAGSPLRPTMIEEAVNSDLGEFREWGLGRLRCYIVGFAFVKTYRVLANEYNGTAGLWDLEEKTGER